MNTLITLAGRAADSHRPHSCGELQSYPRTPPRQQTSRVVCQALMTKQTFHGPGTDSSPAARNKSFERHSDMATLSALKRLQLELAETRQALIEAERQRQREQQHADEAEQERQYERQ